MPDHPLVQRAAVVLAQTAHLLAAHFGYRRVVAYQVTCHDGSFVTTLSLTLRRPLPSVFGLHQASHGLSKLPPTLADYPAARPGRFRQKATRSRQTLPTPYLAQQPRQRPAFLAQHQPQQYGYEIQPLGLAKQATKAIQKLAQSFIQADNRQSHRSPRGFGLFDNFTLTQRERCFNFSVGKVLLRPSFLAFPAFS
jgi:hypothetical protein